MHKPPLHNIARMSPQKPNHSTARASRVTKVAAKVPPGNLKKHNIQHLRSEISGLDSSTFPSTVNIYINDIIQTALLERLNKPRSTYEYLSLDIQSHFYRTNACFDHIEDRLQGIYERLNCLDPILDTLGKIEKNNQEIFAIFRNISEAWLVQGSVVRGYEQAGPSRIRELSQDGQ
ncbi:hypothetical protein KCU73_g3380, partial [Aureobasidium melanogenum]